jgi:hypoxanthine phosphoribosyltransferase
LLTLQGARFAGACRELMRLVERDYQPTLIVGIRTGGLVVAEAMVRDASAAIPVLPLTCRRATTGTKSRMPLLRQVLGRMPRAVVDLLRRIEHRFVAAGSQTGQRELDQGESTAIARRLQATGPARVLVADDAVDSGATLAAVLRLLRELCPRDAEIRSAAITQTLAAPAVRPDYVLFRQVLCRFPWSFDASV